MDALAGERVDVAGGVADDEQVVVVGGGNALGAQAQRGGLHALHLGVGAHRLADEGVALQRALMQPLQIRLLCRGVPTLRLSILRRAPCWGYRILNLRAQGAQTAKLRAALDAETAPCQLPVSMAPWPYRGFSSLKDAQKPKFQG